MAMRLRYWYARCGLCSEGDAKAARDCPAGPLFDKHEKNIIEGSKLCAAFWREFRTLARVKAPSRDRANIQNGQRVYALDELEIGSFCHCLAELSSEDLLRGV